MNEARLISDISDSIKILKKFGLYKEENFRKPKIYDNSKFSEEFIRISQKKEYLEIYNVAIKNADYDVLLQDDSFFQFSYEKKGDRIVKYRFAFYQNPRDYPTYNDFLEKEFSTTEEICGSIFLEEYEQVISEAQLNIGAIPIRYDYDEGLYDSKYHPVSHIHIGNNNSIRIGCSKIITPDVFTLFIIKQVYFKDWKKICVDEENNYKVSLEIKKRCFDIEDEYLQKEELNHLHFN